MTDHKRLRELAEAATPGPWRITPGYKASQEGRYDDDVSVIEDASGEPVIEHVYYDGHHTIVRPRDTAFIAAANPQTVIGLLDDNERLQGDEATMKLSRMMGLGDPVRPDIHNVVVRQRDEARQQLAEERRLVSHYRDIYEALGERLEWAVGGDKSSIERLSCLVEQLAVMIAERDALGRELERWRHGATIEGDFVCPDSLALAAMTSARDEACAIAADWMRSANIEGNEELAELQAAATRIAELRKVGKP